eukprot:TRINITY_DN47753_c0_g1_i1.p1 TRINITY_DN47753_c0_g1~~TRINITY_DN47753_c0_g1_i1.p1  ORF type:complete len:764 (-),score=140.67 TRINITY_DN47753_c0_g1_i1:52-2319(-)
MGICTSSARWLLFGLLLLAGHTGEAFNPVPCKDLITLDCGMNFFKEVYEQFQIVQEEVVIMPFFLRPRLKIFSSVQGQPPDLSLSDLIMQAIHRKVHVWILGWDNAASEKYLGTFQDHEYELLYERAGEDQPYLHLMLDTGRELVASVYYLPHIKSYSFDRKVAYVGGIDFVENRLDTPQHLRPNPLLVKVDQDEKHPSGNEKPWQDAMVKVTGVAARQVAMILIERWWTYCKSPGYGRAQAMRPVSALLDSTVWHVKGAMHASAWKDAQCEQLPEAAILGIVELEMSGSNRQQKLEIQIETPQVQSQGLDPNLQKSVSIESGQKHRVNVTGLRALDTTVPQEITILVNGISTTVKWTEQAHVDVDGGILKAEWLPEGLSPQDEEGQMCKVTLSGSSRWMGTGTVVRESYDEMLNMIRNAKRFVFIENQYFSTDFPSTSPECQHEHDRTRAVLYSGATNRVGEVLLDRLKRAAFLKEQFSVAFVLPLGTEPGSFYPNLRGAYCFEQTVEDFWKEHKFESDWRDYFSFFFIGNAVSVPTSMGGPGNAFYGIFTHTKAMVVDDEIAYIGSANINDRSLFGDRDAEVGLTVWNGTYPRQLRETLLASHLGGAEKANLSRFTASLRDVAEANAEELRQTMGISFPQGSVTTVNGTRQLFGMEGLLNHAPNQAAVLEWPRSRVVAGGGGVDHFDWYVVPNAPRPPKLQGLLFPWSRQIWGMPKMTNIAQIFSNEFNYLERPERAQEALGPIVTEKAPLFM